MKRQQNQRPRRAFLASAVGGAIAAWGLARQWARGAKPGRGTQSANAADPASQAGGTDDQSSASGPIWIGHL